MTEDKNPEQNVDIGQYVSPDKVNKAKNLARTALFFDSMLTPRIITFVYWIFLLAVLVSSLGMMFSQSFLGGLITLVLGALGVRIWCELMIVLFKINTNIQKIADR